MKELNFFSESTIYVRGKPYKHVGDLLIHPFSERKNINVNKVCPSCWGTKTDEIVHNGNPHISRCSCLQCVGTGSRAIAEESKHINTMQEMREFEKLVKRLRE